MSDDDQRLRDIAYRLWVDAGRPQGRADEFWFAAQALLDAEAPPAEPAAEEPPPEEPPAAV